MKASGSLDAMRQSFYAQPAQHNGKKPARLCPVVGPGPRIPSLLAEWRHAGLDVVEPKNMHMINAHLGPSLPCRYRR